MDPCAFLGIPLKMTAHSTASVASVLLSLFCAMPAIAQRPATPKPPLVGTVSPGAIGPAAPTPRQMGGLETRPLNASVPSQSRVDIAPRYRDRRFLHSPYGYYPLGVADAPLLRGGAIRYTAPVENFPSQRWIPTTDKPRWRRDPTLADVQAWRDLIVNDVVCDGYGTCIEREQRVRAYWVAVCRCYLFADALGRRWLVE